MIIYAIVNKDKICTGILETNIEITNEMYVATESSENIIGKKYVNGQWVEYTQEPRVETLTEQEKTVLETAVNIDYLVCLADMGV